MGHTNDLDRHGECMPQRCVSNIFLDHIWDPVIGKFMHFALDLLIRKSYYRSFSCFSEEWLGFTIVRFGAVTVSVCVCVSVTKLHMFGALVKVRAPCL